MLYTKDNLGKYRQQLIDMGITDEDQMVEVMNFLRQLAEIGIEAYEEKQKRAVESGFSV